MPHIVFNKTLDLQEFSRLFTSFFIREPYIIKIQDLFLNRDGKVSFVPTTVVDEKNQQFLIEIIAKDNKTTVRLFPGTDPEKTDGVKMAIGYLAKMIQSKFPDLVISKTNIAEFIPDKI